MVRRCWGDDERDGEEREEERGERVARKGQTHAHTTHTLRSSKECCVVASAATFVILAASAAASAAPIELTVLSRFLRGGFIHVSRTPIEEREACAVVFVGDKQIGALLTKV